MRPALLSRQCNFRWFKKSPQKRFFLRLHAMQVHQYFFLFKTGKEWPKIRFSRLTPAPCLTCSLTWQRMYEEGYRRPDRQRSPSASGQPGSEPQTSSRSPAQTKFLLLVLKNATENSSHFASKRCMVESSNVDLKIGGLLH